MTPVNDTTSWGIGFIRANVKGTFRGFLSSTDQVCYIGNGKIAHDNETRPKIVQTDYVFLCDYSTLLYKVYQINGTRYNICANSIAGGVWVEFNDLSKSGLAFDTYVSYMGKNKNMFENNPNEKVGIHINMGVNLLASCLNLRDQPSTEGKIITCLQNNLDDKPNFATTHLVIQEVIDGWARVMARIYIFDGNEADNPDSCAATVIKEYYGYVKVIGKNGIPNIWYATNAY